MGRDIYTIIERRKGTGQWECVEQSNARQLRRCPELEAIMAYNALEGEVGIVRKPLREWVTTLSEPARRELFCQIVTPLTDMEPIFKHDEFDYESFKASLSSRSECEEEMEEVSAADAKNWIKQKEAFLLTDDIISNPDTCFWNWCSVKELDWALDLFEEGAKIKLGDDDDYRQLLQAMKRCEEPGCEVRLVYYYDFATPWLSKKFCRNKPSMQDEDVTENKFIRYMLQGRPEEFIACVESLSNRCYFGMLTFYQFAYANYILLSDEGREVDKPTLEGCKRILDYMATIIDLPEKFDNAFERFLKKYAWYDDNDKIRWMLNAELDKLKSLGYQETDCLLYEAGLKLRYDEVRRLLALGADPNARICAKLSPANAAQKAEEHSEWMGKRIFCLTYEVRKHIRNVFDDGHIYSYWRTGRRRKDTPIRNDDLRRVFQGAAYCLMQRMIGPFI